MEEKDKKIAELEASLKAKDEELAKVSDSVKALTEKISEKDRIIEVKNADIIGARKKYKTLAEMTEEDKEQFSAKELELQQRLEDFDLRQAEFEKQQVEQANKERTSRWTAAIKKRVGDNPEHAKQLEENMKSFVGHDQASTEEEINSLADRGLNLFGDAKPNPIKTAMNGSGEAPGQGEGANFAETEAGKSLADSMNLGLEAGK